MRRKRQDDTNHTGQDSYKRRNYQAQETTPASTRENICFEEEKTKIKPKTSQDKITQFTT